MATGRKAEQAARTRETLVEAARELFAAHGFAATSTEQILAAAGVTRGALYHHFADKADLFAAVCDRLHAEAAAAILAAVDKASAGSHDPLEVLMAGCEAWIDHVASPRVSRILVVEAMTVLGWRRWNDMDRRHGAALLREGIEAVQAAGRLTLLPAGDLAILLNGAINQAVLAAVGEDEGSVETKRLKASLRTLLTRLG
jgi:AcrR family transcriptional regulator